MANQTVTTLVNHDDASVLGLANGEDYTINGGGVIINCDTRWGQNDAIIGNVTISSTLGGEFRWDGRDVWEIPFDAATGNVPALGTLGTNTVTGGTSGATGELFRVWNNTDWTPLAAGGAIPSSGWIKLRTKTGTFVDNEVITLPGGATVTVNSATGGKRSWIHITGEYQGLITIPRLGALNGYGTWYELGITDGTDDQVIPIPIPDTIPGVWVETGPGTNVYERWENAGRRWQTSPQYIPTDVRGKYFGQWFSRGSMGTTSGSAVVTTSDTSGFAIGAPVIMSGGFSAIDRLFITAINPGVSITVSTNANSTGTQTITTVTRSITFAARASNACGEKPPTGCRVLIPNILVSVTQSNFAGNMSNGTMGDRWELLTTAAGVVNLTGVCGAGLYVNTSAAYDVLLEDCAFSNSIVVANTANNTTLRNVIVGLESTREAQAVTLSSLFTNLTVDGFRATRYAGASTGQNTISISDCANITITDAYIAVFGSTSAVTRGNADVRTLALARCFDVTIDDSTIIGGRVRFDQVVRATLVNTLYADQINGSTVNTNPLVGAIEVGNTSSNITIDGFTSYGGLANVHPYTTILLTNSSAATVEFKNLGTPSAPYNMGSANACGLIVSATVTLGLTLRRLYAANTRTNALSLANTVQNVICDNIWGDAADSQAIAALNVTCRGCRWTNSVTGQNAVYGRHWEDAFTSTTTGRLLIACNEPLPTTLSQVSTTFGAGAGFTSTGSVSMPNTTDVVIWEMQYFGIGFTGFANNAPTITGTNTANFTLEFQWDTGAGYNGTWLALNGANLSGIGAINPVTGVKLKVRATVNTANASNALTYIRIDTITNATDQQLQYPLPVVQNVGSVSGFMANSRIVVYNETTDTVVHDAIVATSPLLFTYPEGTNFSEGDVLRIYHVWYNTADGSTATKKARTSSVVGPTGWTALIEQEMCDVYAAYYGTFGTTGQAVYASGDFVRDLGNLHIDLDDADDLWYAHRLFMFDKYDVYFNSGRRSVFLQVEATDAANISIGTLQLDNLNANTAYQGDTINVVNASSTLPVTNPTTGGGGITMYSGGKVLTTTAGGIAPSEAQIKSWVMAAEIIPGWTLARAMRKIAAMTIAKSSGNTPSGGTVVFRNLDDTADEMSATVDANGNRTAVTQGS